MKAMLKPQIREILWAYEKDKDLAKYVERMLELFEENERIIWNEAIVAG